MTTDVTDLDSEKKMLSAVAASGGLQTEAEALLLYRIAAGMPDGAKILEIGSYLGASTTAFGYGILSRECELYCLDCWHDYHGQGFHADGIAPTGLSDRDILHRFLSNTSFLGSQLRLLKGTTAQFSSLLPDSFFDLVFIDGAHNYASVMHDIKLAFRVTRRGGVVCGHDYHSDGYDVVRAVDELIYRDIRIQHKGVFPNTSIWYAITPEADGKSFCT